MRFSAVIILLMVVHAAAFAQEVNPKRALEAYEEGDYDTAIRLYSELLAEDSDDSRLKFNLGDAFYKKGTFNSAKSDYEDALTFESPVDKAKAFYNLGNTLFKMGRAEESLIAYKEAMKLDPTDLDAKFNFEFVKRTMENQEQQQEEEEQQEQQEGESDQQDESEQENQEQKQEEDQQQNSEEEKKQEEQKQKQQQQEQEEQRSKEEIEQLMEALEQNEAEALRDYINLRTRKMRQPEKDW